MAGNGILIADTLIVKSDIGECQIQLCVGDITALPREDAVDVLVISAFPGKFILYAGAKYTYVSPVSVDTTLNLTSALSK